MYIKYDNNINKFNKNIDIDTFNYLKINQKLDSDLGFYIWLSKNNLFYQLINKDLENNKIKIINWCDKNYIDHDLFFKYLNNYLDLKIRIITNKKNYDNNLNELSSDWIKTCNDDFYSILQNNTIKEKILISFIIGYSSNIALRLNLNDKKYYSFAGSNYDILKTKVKRDIKYNSLCKNINNIIMYFNLQKIIIM